MEEQRNQTNSVEELLAQMSNYRTFKAITISTVDAAYLVDIGGANYVDLTLLYPGHAVYDITNGSDSAVATVIARSWQDDEATLQNIRVLKTRESSSYSLYQGNWFE
jgi:hypothetical protein